MSVKQNIAAALKELEVLRQSERKIKARFEREMKPHQTAFDEATAEIRQKFAGQMSPVAERVAALEKEIHAQMLCHLDAGGEPKLKLVKSENLTAEVVQTAARREVDAETFFNFVPAIHRRGESFWSCLSVQIGKADKFLGEKINQIASIKNSYKVVIKEIEK
jgi:hypothetical protein